jgi:Cof subfamily protein (haloacid dehalogenase superfamily)
MRLVAFDLDGTLVRSDNTVSPRSIAAIRRAHDRGWTVVLATGRPPFLAQMIIDALGGAVDYLVANNGSEVIELPDTILHEYVFAAADAFAAIRTLRAAVPGLGFALATDEGFAHERGFAERMPQDPGIPAVADVTVIGGTQARKVLAFHDDHGVHDLLAMLPEHLGDDLVVQHLGADAVEIGPAGIDKGNGLQWLCGHLGLAAGDVVAFGDNMNDRTMLRWVGHGVAMANADAGTRAAADEVTASNDDDGVAVVLERLLG